jgi:eukaryotic-like serine/threonine-protein kinase
VEHPEVPIDLLVKAVLDGQPIDWNTTESSAWSEDRRAQIRHFRTLAAIAALHRESEAERTEQPLATTESWGSLRLLERIGAGSFGEVYRAWDTKLDREVALKLLRHRSSEDWSEARALEEGRLLARIRHPNVATVFGADRVGDRVGIWMEFIRGRTLQQVLRSHGALGPKEATAIGLDLCLALSAVHRAGLLHRDVKAQNVMREDGGRIVLTDFGAGRDAVDDRPAELAGTPLYLAPEIFAGAPATGRSDIYSLGVLLYHLVTVSYPVKGRTAADLRAAHGDRQRSWLRDERPDLPDRFVQTVERALQPDPDLRYESAGAMEAALARLGSISDSPGAGQGEPAVAATPVATPPSRRRASRVAVVAALAIAAGFGAAAVLLPSATRDRIFGRFGRTGRGAAVGGFPPTATVRKVPLNPWYAGTPSLDGTLFSMTDDSGNVVVVDLRTGAARRLTTDAVLGNPGQSAEFSTISPDNRLAAYTWFALDGKSEIRVIDLEGAHPRVLLRSETVDYPMPFEWSRDGKWILATLTRPDHSKVLALVSAEDGTVRPVKELGTDGPQHASMSPDGEFIVYDVHQRPASAARDIFIIRANGREERRLIEHPANDADPVWMPDGRRVLFISDRSTTSMDLWSVTVAGGIAQGEPELIHRNIGSLWLRGLTDTGSYYYWTTVGAVDVYQADVVNGAVKNAKALPLSYAGSNISSVWSPDGERLAYASRRGLIGFDRASAALAVRDATTGEQRDVVPALKSFLVWSWTLDGRHVLAQATDNSGETGNFLIDTDSGQTTAVMRNGPISQDRTFAGGTFMPDGRLLFLHKGKQQLFARDLQTGSEEMVFDYRAEHMQSPDGKYKVAPDGRTLALSARLLSDKPANAVVVTVLGGGAAREVVRGQPGEYVSFEDWTSDGQAVLFLKWSKTSNSLWRVSIHGGDPEPLGLAMERLRDVRMNPQGTKITYTAGVPWQELWVLENFLPR